MYEGKTCRLSHRNDSLDRRDPTPQFHHAANSILLETLDDVVGEDAMLRLADMIFCRSVGISNTRLAGDAPSG